MDARFYNSEEIDTERLASDVVNVYMAQGYQTQQIGNKDQMLVQLKKGGDFEAIIGMQAAVSLTLQRTAGGLLAMIGQQRWIDKAAVGAVGIVAFPVLWPLALTAGAGAIRQASLGNQVLNVVDGLVRQQRPGIQAGPIPMNIVPQIQQQWGQPPAQQTPVYVPPAQIVGERPPVQQMLAAPTYTPPVEAPVQAPAPAQLHCPYCNTPYEPGDTFCTGCGRALSTPRQYCANCNSELKPGLSFCPKCGASTFNATSSQQTIPRPGPAPTPMYAPPAPQAQTYTPPMQPTPPAPRPETPVYQPPVQPAYTPPTPQNPPVAPPTQVYYTASSQQTADAGSAPSSQPTEPYYVPPVTQEPTVKPQPKVTFVPGTPKQEPPPPQKPRPQKQYYIPSNQAQQDQQTLPAAEQPTLNDAAQPTIVEATIQPATQAATWGSLIFTDGSQVSLSGERAIVGRYDNDLGGVPPEVDLSQKQGADTVSRVHAALEHSAGTYTLTDLNSTNATRVNNKRLEPDKATPINDGDALQFGKVQVTFKAY